MTGHNHGRAQYQRTTAGDCVVLYYWHCEIPEQRGWWFGPAVGGEDVWAHHRLLGGDLEEPPPVQGWISCATGQDITDLSVQRITQDPSVPRAAPPLTPEPDEEPVPETKRYPRLDSGDHKELFDWLLSLDGG